MSKKNNTGSRHPNWSLVFMARDGARVNKDGRKLIFARAKDVLGYKDEDEEVMVGADHRAIATAEIILRKLSLDAEDAIEKGAKAFHAWDNFNSFRRGILKLSYLPRQQRNDEEQSKDTTEAEAA